MTCLSFTLIKLNLKYQQQRNECCKYSLVVNAKREIILINIVHVRLVLLLLCHTIRCQFEEKEMIASQH